MEANDICISRVSFWPDVIQCALLESLTQETLAFMNVQLSRSWSAVMKRRNRLWGFGNNGGFCWLKHSDCSVFLFNTPFGCQLSGIAEVEIVIFLIISEV